MTASSKTTIPTPANPLLAERLERLRLQIVAAELAKIVGRNIQAARLEKGIRTQRALADMIRKCDPEMAAGNTRVSIWERGAETPSARYLQALTRVLDKNPDWFYTDHSKEATPEPFTPNIGRSTDGQLDRIEEKIDRLLKLVDLPEATGSTGDAAPSTHGLVGRAIDRAQSQGESTQRGQQSRQAKGDSGSA